MLAFCCCCCCCFLFLHFLSPLESCSRNHASDSFSAKIYSCQLMLICSHANIVLKLKLLFCLPDAYPEVFIELNQISLGLCFAKLRKTNTLSSVSRDKSFISLIILPPCPVGFVFLHGADKNCPLNFSQDLPSLSYLWNYTFLSWEEGIRVIKVA